MGAAGLKLPFLKPMCNLYSITTNQAAIIALFRVINRYVGNLPPMPGVFPDYPAPVIRDTGAGREMVTMRWGMPPPPRTPGPPRSRAGNTVGGPFHGPMADGPTLSIVEILVIALWCYRGRALDEFRRVITRFTRSWALGRIAADLGL